MRRLPHRRAAVVVGLLAAHLAGGTAVAGGAVAAPREPSPAATRGPDDGKQHTAKDKDRSPAPTASPSPAAGEADDPEAAPFVGPTAPAKPGTHAKKAKKADAPTRSQGGPAGQPVLAPEPVVPVPTRPRTDVLTEPPPPPAVVESLFLRTAVPVRPLTRPVAVVRPGPPLWRVHEPVDRPLRAIVRTVAGDPTAPLLLAGLVALFLLVQHRIDRNDPKLSRGHREDPPDLRFGPARRLQTAL